MLKLYTWKTPNGYKIPIMLEELALPYEIIPVSISKGEQKTQSFLKMNPNHKIPVLVDEEAKGGPLTVFESGAILIYLGEKYGKLLPGEGAARYAVLQWLMFQMASVGPMLGQANHFVKYAPEQVPYAVKRYTEEADRIVGVLNTRLADAEYLGGDYSIADIATWPWIRARAKGGYVQLDEFPHVQRWHNAIMGRAAAMKGIENVDKACARGPAVCMPKFD